MKTPLCAVLPIVMLTAASAIAQEPIKEVPASDHTVILATHTEAQITGGISDGKPGIPAARPEPIAFEVERRITKRVHVVEAPEMQGLPAPQGTIDVTVQLVKDPGLPDPPPSLPALPALPVSDPVVLAHRREMRQKYLATQIAFVSATVYDHSRTYLSCYPNGRMEKQICGWSNLDFMCFSGFGTYQVYGRDGKTRKYELLMGIDGIDTRQRSAFLAKHGRTFVAPVPPALPDLASGGPAFVITTGDTTDHESMALIEGMHDLYLAEGPRMEASYHARIKAYEERKAYLLANPPVPKNVTVSFWHRDHPLRQTTNTGTEGGNP